MVREQTKKRGMESDLNKNNEKSFYSTYSKPKARDSVPNVAFVRETSTYCQEIKARTTKYRSGPMKKITHKTHSNLKIEEDTLSYLSIDLEMFKAHERIYSCKSHFNHFIICMSFFMGRD